MQDQAPAAQAGRTRQPADMFADEVAPETAARTAGFKDLIIAGPAPSPLLRAENFYRYQIMLRTGAMSRLSQELAKIVQAITFPDDVTLAVDIDPVNMS